MRTEMEIVQMFTLSEHAHLSVLFCVHSGFGRSIPAYADEIE